VSRPLCLASRSPRRREILEWAGFEVLVKPADVDEEWDGVCAPPKHAVQLAERKARGIESDQLLVAGDTVVHLNGALFDKPRSDAEAIEHLSALSGRWHQVTTGVCVRRRQQLIRFSTTTSVRFRALSTAEIERYVATGEARDKAGAYGIQGIGGNLVAELRGSWTNVKGLPLEDTLLAIADIEEGRI
jgi:septum formation protein